MSNYVRVKLPGGCYFFTLVTFGWYKFLTSEPARLILRQVWKEVRKKHPFNVEAICLLPDHLHCIWRLPEGDDDYPKRWRLIKGMFSRRYLKAGGIAGQRNQSRRGKEKLRCGRGVIGSIPFGMTPLFKIRLLHGRPGFRTIIHF